MAEIMSPRTKAYTTIIDLLKGKNVLGYDLINAIEQLLRDQIEECAKIADEQAEMRKGVARRSAESARFTHEMTAEACKTVASDIRDLAR
jgi:hypothetical protein